MNRASTALLVALVALSGAAGCKKPRASSRTTATVTSPPTLVWKDMSIEMKELPGARGDVFLAKTLAYQVSFSGLPEGTTLAVGGGEVRSAGVGGMVESSVDLADAVAALPPAQALDYTFHVDPKATATLTFPGGVMSSFAMPPTSVSFSITDGLKACSDTPMTFGKKDAAQPSEHTIVYLGTSAEVLGPAKTMADVDWVALEQPSGTRNGKKCSGYKKTGAAKADSDEKTYVLSMVDRKVTVYERRTSKAIASREFKAKEVCPMMSFGDEAKSYPDSEEIKAWLRTVRGQK